MNTNEIVKLYRQQLSKIDINEAPLDLCNGVSGILFLNTRLSILSSKDLTNYLKILYERACTVSDLDILNGISGISLTLREVIRAGLVEGDINLVSVDIDNQIMRSIFTNDNILNDSRLAIQLVIYFITRVSDESNKQRFILYKELIIYIFQRLFDNLDASFFIAPRCFSLFNYELPFLLLIMAKMASFGIFKEQIERKLFEIEDQILSIPYLDCNKTVLLFGLNEISLIWPRYKSPTRVLIHSINTDRIISEIGMSNTLFNTGLTGLYYIIKRLKGVFGHTVGKTLLQMNSMILSSKPLDCFRNDQYFKTHFGLFGELGSIMFHIGNSRYGEV